ncbi:protein-glutamate O-methyltransferase CheR [Vitiosangium sp. GDMCC 1.1324]|uniref:CheR family methyltransferase n=1 Tax=Vitiosangium sp. (strain GDMCC 1.1324) TaxID=2138576 RepID=UPI000D37D8DC|nr:CheR family methyltransferase [Vitiosangium sp. GDMCC 1.1324]PTL83977.1 SAM-dependent methyltransferase [Vitiosangium sp. GDMCC 1.1324]
MSSGVESQQVLARAREVVSSCTGFRDTAISPTAVDRVVRAELARGRSAMELLAELQRPGTPLARALLDAVLVGETYFFRHPEQFRFLANEAVPAALRRGGLSLRGWSAGCASGEETYSIAACLLNTAPKGVRVEVLGTDLHEGRLEIARRGLYGNWSRREAGPLLHPLYVEVAESRVSILDAVRSVTRFAQGNLLEPLPESYGSFDVIFCRNVLTYFSPDAVQVALGHLARALVPGGHLLLGTVEVDHPPAGLVRVGPPELQAFRRPTPKELTPPPRPVAREPESVKMSVRAATPPPAPPPPAPTAVGLHTEALQRIEGGDEAGAATLLEKLLQQFRDYLPGMLELALLRERAGAREAAFALMHTVRDIAARLPPDQIIEGPEPLPARFYRASADAFLTLGAIE